MHFKKSFCSRSNLSIDDTISAKKEEDQVWKRAWILDGYTFCPFRSVIGYGFWGNYGNVWTYLSFPFQMNKKEREIFEFEKDFKKYFVCVLI